MSKLDLNAVAATLGAIKSETQEELEARIKRENAEHEAKLEKEKADADHLRWKDRWLFTGSGAVAILMLLVSVYLSIWGSAESAKWAQAISTAITAGGVGFVAGKIT